MFRWLLPFLLFFGLTAQAQDNRYLATQELIRLHTTTNSPSAFAVDTATDALEWINTSREATPVTQICYRYGLRVGTPPTYKIGIEGVTAATGRADGVYATGTGECSITFTPPADTSIDNTNVCQTLTGATCALTRGQIFAVTIRYNAGTVDGSNYSSFVQGFSGALNTGRGGSGSVSTYAVSVAAGVGTKATHLPPIYWKNSVNGRVFGNPMLLAVTHAYSSTDSPDEYALRFQNPCPTGQQYEISGGHFHSTVCATGKSLLIQLYNGVTVLQTATIACDISTITASARTTEFYFTDTTLAPLDCNSTYRIGIAPQEVSSGLTWYSSTVTANADFDAYPWGKETYASSRTNAGAWTDVTTERPAMGLITNRLIAVPVVAAVHGGHLSKPFNKGFQP